MPLVLFFVYFILETVTFWAVAQWIGLGWALVAFFVTMFFGMSLAMFEVRRMMASKVVKGQDGALYMQDQTPGRTAGNVGLTIAGGVLLSLPGFLSTIAGALLIFPPTRALFRKVATIGMFKSIENMGVRVYEHSPMSSRHTSYGTFGGGMNGQQAPKPSHPENDPMVIDEIDEDELRRWSEGLDPDDFNGGEDGQGGSRNGGGEKR